MINTHATEISFLLLVGWLVLLITLMAAFRSSYSLLKSKPANAFDPKGDDVGAFGRRLNRVHANAYEFLPFVIVTLLFAIATEHTEMTDGLAPWVVALRIGQGLTHLVSTTVPAVLVRFTVFFIPQIVILGIWVATLLNFYI